MFKLQHNYTYFISWQSNAQNFPNSASKFQMFKLDLEKAKEPVIKLATSTRSKKKQGNSKIPIYFCFIDYTKGFDCVDYNKLWKILKEMGVPDHFIC